MFEKSNDAKEIAAFASERGITRLVHFTPFQNLLGIFEMSGIWSRRRIGAYAKEHGDLFLLDYISWNDQQRYDNRLDCVNLSIQHINAPLLRRFREKFAECDLWCVLEVDPVCLQKKGVTFTVGNAASSYVKANGSACGLAGLSAAFAERVITGNSYGLREQTRAGLAPADPTDPQAEVLFPEEIPLPLIKALVVENEEQLRRVKGAIHMNNPGIILPPLVIRPEDFKNRPIA